MKKILIGVALLTMFGCHNEVIKNVKVGDTVYFKKQGTDLLCVGRVINRTLGTITITDNKVMHIYSLEDFNSSFGGYAKNMKLNIQPEQKISLKLLMKEVEYKIKKTN